MSGGNRLVWPNPFSVDASGPRAAAMLYFYATGTNTPQQTFSDPALTTPNPNPIPADALGQFGDIFLLASPAYRVVLTDVAGNEIWTADPVSFAVASNGAVPVGAMLAYGGSAAPAGYLLCYGQAVSRTTYALLFAAIGTAYGAGDGTTTFNVPDKRGRASFGKDDMGGVAANRVTSAGSGIDGLTLGAAGGDQATQAHNHTLTDPGHNHTLTDPGHAHQEGDYSTTHDFGVGTGTTGGTSFDQAFTNNYALTEHVTTGITVASATTGITVASYGAGAGQNMPPAQIDTVIVYAGA